MRRLEVLAACGQDHTSVGVVGDRVRGGGCADVDALFGEDFFDDLRDVWVSAFDIAIRYGEVASSPRRAPSTL